MICHHHFGCDKPSWFDHPSRFVRGLKIAGAVLLGLACIAAFGALFGFVIQALWNWLMPAVFGLGAITFWQAIGICLLAKLLFGSHGPHGHGCHGRRRRAEFRRFWEQEGFAAYETWQHKQTAPPA